LSNDLTPEAVFGAAGPALFVLRCDRPRARLVLERPARGASAEGGMIVRASGAERRLPAIALLPSAAAPFGGIMAQLGARDPLLDAIAFSRGKFIVAVGGAPDLVLPSWAEVSRVIEDCRAP
jgi:hypothetical protein